jgi:hypothetical protein
MHPLRHLIVVVLIFFAAASCKTQGDGQDIGADLPPDFVVTDMEISQGTQNLDNDMPLVANRWTIVRVFVGDANGKGAENVTSRLLGFRTCPGPGCPPNVNGPVPLPVLSPWNKGGHITVQADGGSRVNLDDSFWFFLPKSWREFPGNIQIVAEVNHDDGVNESSSDNNSLSKSATFVQADTLQVRAVPLHLHEFWDKDKPEVLYECDESDFWRIFLNMFRYHPIDRLLVTCPAAPLEPFPHEIATVDIQPFEWDMGDPDICGDAHTRLKWLMAQESLPGRWQYAGLIRNTLPGLCNGWAGAANGDAVWLKMRSTVSGGDPPWLVSGGVTLAHELGHSWLPNPDHILCKGNEGPPNGQADTQYPYIYPNCRFSAANARGWYGMDVYYALWPDDLTQPTVLPNGDPDAMVSPADLFPLMGYLRPRWTDPYTYCELLNGYVASGGFFCDRDQIDPNPGGQLTGGKPRAPISTTLTTGSLVMVSGKVNFEDGTGKIYQVALQPADEVFAHVIEEAEAKLAEQAAVGATGRFQVQAMDPASGAVYSVPIISEENGHEVPIRSEGFFELLSFPPGAVAVGLFDLDSGTLVDSRTVSPSAPSVDFSMPGAGETLVAGSMIKWRGVDPDGDPLRYTLRYSPDGGNSWHVIALDTPDEEYTLPSIDRLPGSTAGMLSISANDGFQTATAELSGTVVVPGKPPRVAVISPEPGGTFSTSDPVLLSAVAQDVEDGVLSDDAAVVWSSDLDGNLGEGTDLVLDPGSLSQGHHRITVRATDSDGMTAEAPSFDLFISGPPT